MKKSTIAIILAAVLIVLGSGGVYATGQIARSNAISEQDAINFAYVDAAVSPDDGVVSRIEFDYERGQFIYEIEFSANGVEYDYKVNSSNGRILERSFEEIEGYKPAPTSTSANTTNKPADTTNSGGTDVATDGATISLEEAKNIALAKMGVTADQVIFEKAKLERDDGVLKYDIEYYVSGKFEYDCEINAADGTVIEDSYEELVIPATSNGGSGNSGSTGGSSGSGSSDNSGSTGGSSDSGNSGSTASSGNTGSSSGGSGSSASSASSGNSGSSGSSASSGGSSSSGSSASSGNSGSSSSSSASKPASKPAPAPAPAPAPSVVYDDDDDDWDDQYDDADDAYDNDYDDYDDDDDDSDDDDDDSDDDDD